MKVGTDGTLLGAWAQGGNRILDVGTGTGLIALMMAQRFPKAQVTGVDIDGQACQQARENAEASPFRIEVVQADVERSTALSRILPTLSIRWNVPMTGGQGRATRRH